MVAAQGGAAAGRHVAVRNFLAVEVDAAEVQSTLDAAVSRCKAPDCEVLESSLSRDARAAPPSARLRLRISPATAAGYVDEITRRADLIERRTESEDKTEQVVDLEARLKNTAELRDRLRKLLATPNVPVKDLVEVESNLARVQGELDAAQGRRLALANETGKVAVAIDIRSRRAIGAAGAWEPVSRALGDVGHTLAASIGGLITFVVAILPWTVLAVPLVVWWRRRRRARQTLTQK